VTDFSQNSQVWRANAQIKAAAIRSHITVWQVQMSRLFGRNWQSWYESFR